MGDDTTPHKRKRPIGDQGDRDQKKVQTEDRKLGIENLHLDVGEKYLLCRTRKAPFITTLKPKCLGGSRSSFQWHARTAWVSPPISRLVKAR